MSEYAKAKGSTTSIVRPDPNALVQLKARATGKPVPMVLCYECRENGKVIEGGQVRDLDYNDPDDQRVIRKYSERN